MWIKSLKFGQNSGPIVGFEGVCTQLEIDLTTVWIWSSFGLFIMWIKNLKFGQNSGQIVVFEGVFTQLEIDLHTVLEIDLHTVWI